MEAEQANRKYEEFIDSLFGAPVVLVREIFDGTIRCFSDGRVERLYRGINWREVEHTANSHGYNTVNINRKPYQRSRLIAYAFLGLENPDGDVCELKVDHISGNTLDNSVKNLRVLTQAKNTQNSNSKCYNFDHRKQKWRVYIVVDGKQKFYGYFKHETEAKARAIEMKLFHFESFRPRHAYNLANGL